ncbi:hypothetical protein C8R46DRAFT_890873 [Mycena filopes]|nr:hypothetical protein C8R46DRAFT_890873 [Mycena filopes]
MRKLVSSDWEWPSWKPPANSNPEIHDWLSSLRIPLLNSEPSLLLHGLGNLQKDDSMLDRIADEIFRPKKCTFLVNTTGSGKTRHLLEALCLHWGFYFTMGVNALNDPMGSTDMQNCIQRVADAPDFTPVLSGDQTSGDFKKRLAKNRNISDAAFYHVILARLVIFKHFLDTIVDTRGDGQIKHSDKHLWTLLQLCPAHLAPVQDVFDEMAQLLYNAKLTKKKCAAIQKDVLSEVHKIIFEHSPNERSSEPLGFFFVLDEAQTAAGTMLTAFRSEAKHSVERSILRQLIMVLVSFILQGCGLVVAGTGVDHSLLRAAMSSAMAKFGSDSYTSNTGAFGAKMPNLHEAYIKRYLPPQLLKTQEGHELFFFFFFFNSLLFAPRRMRHGGHTTTHFVSNWTK